MLNPQEEIDAGIQYEENGAKAWNVMVEQCNGMIRGAFVYANSIESACEIALASKCDEGERVLKCNPVSVFTAKRLGLLK